MTFDEFLTKSAIFDERKVEFLMENPLQSNNKTNCDIPSRVAEAYMRGQATMTVISGRYVDT